MAIVTAQAQLVALFNAKNSSLAQALTVGDVDFGAVAAYSPTDGADTRNSKLTITAKTASIYFTGAKELHYTRLPAAVIGAQAITEDQANWDTDAKVLAKVNAVVIAAGKTQDEFAQADLTITRTDGTGGDAGKKIVTVAIKAGHIKYLAGNLAVYTITQPIVKNDLSAANGELDTFTN